LRKRFGKVGRALSILRLIPNPPGASPPGKSCSTAATCLVSRIGDAPLRGRDIGMVFPEPMTSSNPVRPSNRQITEVAGTASGGGSRGGRAACPGAAGNGRVADAGRRLKQYPHSALGGMRQRVMIAVALACNPKLIIGR